MDKPGEKLSVQHYSSLDVTNRIRLQHCLKRQFRNAGVEAKAKIQATSDNFIFRRVKNLLTKRGKKRMQMKIKRMRHRRKFPQAPGPRNKKVQYGFIVKNGKNMNKSIKFE
ncbi:hypothetical protein DMENIID0001_039060 [Sergentomyia squamirostris]